MSLMILDFEPTLMSNPNIWKCKIIHFMVCASAASTMLLHLDNPPPPPPIPDMGVGVGVVLHWVWLESTVISLLQTDVISWWYSIPVCVQTQFVSIGVTVVSSGVTTPHAWWGVYASGSVGCKCPEEFPPDCESLNDWQLFQWIFYVPVI